MQEERISAEDLTAFIDGELDEARAREVAAHLATTPSLAEHVAHLMADKERLQDVYGPLINQPVPQALLDRARSPSRPAHVIRWPAVAAAVAALIAIVVAIWVVYGQLAGAANDVLIAEALAARNGALPGGRPVPAASMESPAARDRAVAEDLSLPIKVPDLSKAGYDLAGITVYTKQARPQSVQLRYSNGQGRGFTVYLARRPGPEGFRLVARGPLRVCTWRTAELSAVMVGEMSTNEMLHLASLTYADLDF